MYIIYIIGLVYLVIGFGYAFYIMISEIDPWYIFPVNMLGGPIVLVYNFFRFLVFKKRN